MHIEISLPHHTIKPWIADQVKEKLLTLHRLDPEIVEAKVSFHQVSLDQEHEKICEIELIIYGDTIWVCNRSDTYETAAREALEEITRQVDIQIRHRKDPPEQITSTVKV